MTFKIRLNGANFVSEERERAFDAALAESELTLPQARKAAVPGGNGPGNGNGGGHGKGNGNGNGNGHHDVASVQVKPAISSQIQQPDLGGPDYAQVIEGLERGLTQSYGHQRETLQVHQQYLSNQASYADIFAALMQEQRTLVTADTTAGPRAEVLLEILQSLSRSVEQFHAHQAETLTVHDAFLRQQSAYSESFIELLQAHYGAVLGGNGTKDGGNGAKVEGGSYSRAGAGHRLNAPTSEVREPTKALTFTEVAAEPVAAPTAMSKPEPVSEAEPSTADSAPEVLGDVGRLQVGAAELGEALLTIVSEKTGYPAEMLELEMDMEADLGIDSIKRVEILGALQDQYPALPQVETDMLAELRTLGQVLEQMGTVDEAGKGAVGEGSGDPADVVVAAEEVAHVGRAEPVRMQASENEGGGAGFSAEELGEALLGIVAEKTGYPAEMLELEMDMEADLGIDSIKRVEILGGLQDQYPDLPEVETDMLAELRTLGQILDYMQDARSPSKKV